MKFAPIQTKIILPKKHLSQTLTRSKLSLAKKNCKKLQSIFISAPAGYGKSTLLTQWAQEFQQLGMMVAWLSIDEGDNDWTRFLEYFIGSLELLNPDMGRSAKSTLISGGVVSVFAMVDMVVADLLDSEKPLVMIFDDFHHIQEKKILEFFKLILSHLPEHCLFIISSRGEIPLQKSRMKLSESCLEYGIKDLAFNLEECEHYLSLVQRLDLKPNLINLIYQKTEGWVTAIKLMAMITKTQNSIEGVLNSLAGQDQSISNYLVEEVFECQPPNVQDFLLKTSMLDRFCIELASEIIQVETANLTLQQIEQASLFLVPLDREGKWFRYHHLFKEFLMGRFRVANYGAMKKNYQKAAHWFEKEGFTDEAIQYYLKAKDFDQASALINSHALLVMKNCGDHNRITTWFHALPEAQIERWPLIRIAYLHILATTVQAKEYQREAKKLKEKINQNRKTSIEDEFSLANIELLNAVLSILQDKVSLSKNICQKWLQDWGDQFLPLKGVILSNLGACLVMEGSASAAMNTCQEAEQLLLASQNFYGYGWCQATMAFLLGREGKFQEAIEVYKKSIHFFENKPENLDHAKSLSETLSMELHFEIGALDRVEALIPQAEICLKSFCSADFAISGYGTLARMAFLKEKNEKGFEYLMMGENLGRSVNLKRLEYTFLVLKALRILAIEGFEKAYQYINRYHLLSPECKFWQDDIGKANFQSLSSWLQIQVLICQKKYEEALNQLKLLLLRYGQSGYFRDRVRFYMAQAICYALLGEEKKARLVIMEILKQASSKGLMLTLIEEGAPIQNLMISCLMEESQNSKTEVPVDYIQRFLTLSKEFWKGLNNKKQPEIKEELTKREVEILKKLATRKSNSEIAQTLFISVGTLKWHLNNLYGKLGVNRRIAAVEYARELQLIV